MPVLKVTLNGTDVNPFHKFGLTQNPFPQIAKAETDWAVLQVQSLGGNPIPDTDHIRKVLRGFPDEFVDLCCLNYRKGEMVRFTVEWSEET